MLQVNHARRSPYVWRMFGPSLCAHSCRNQNRQSLHLSVWEAVAGSGICTETEQTPARQRTSGTPPFASPKSGCWFTYTVPENSPPIFLIPLPWGFRKTAATTRAAVKNVLWSWFRSFAMIGTSLTRLVYSWVIPRKMSAVLWNRDRITANAQDAGRFMEMKQPPKRNLPSIRNARRSIMTSWQKAKILNDSP